MLTPAFYRDAVSPGRLYQPFDLCGNDRHSFWLIYPESRKGTRKIRDFRDWIVGSFRRKLPEPALFHSADMRAGTDASGPRRL